MMDEVDEPARGRPKVNVPVDADETCRLEEGRPAAASGNSSSGRLSGALLSEVRIQTVLSVPATARRFDGPASAVVDHEAIRTGVTGSGPPNPTLGRKGIISGGSGIIQARC